MTVSLPEVGEVVLGQVEMMGQIGIGSTEGDKCCAGCVEYETPVQCDSEGSGLGAQRGATQS